MHDSLNTVTPLDREVVMGKPELVLVNTGPAEFRWQSMLPPDEIVVRLRQTADRIEEQIADGQWDEQLQAVGR